MPAKVIRCKVCNGRQRSATGWNVEMKAGVPQWYVCPGCQTPEENAEAEIHAATLTYTGRYAFGRHTAVPKVSDYG